MERTWRWFGKKDKITLAMLKQIGVEGIVTALHDVPLGEVWTREKIRELREYIESYGMRWSVVESLPVTETIKYGGPDRDAQIDIYKQSLRNLSAEGIHTICYNFMPVLDWARTDLAHSTGPVPTWHTRTPMVPPTSISTMPSLPISISISSSARGLVRNGHSSASPRDMVRGATYWPRPMHSPRR